jgi:hypothetical protein
LLTHPGHWLNPLNRGIFAALRGFMLHAPLTKLPAQA